MITWLHSLTSSVSGPAVIIVGLVAMIVMLLCYLEILNEREKAQDEDLEDLHSKLALANMKIRELERGIRRERANPS